MTCGALRPAGVSQQLPCAPAQRFERWICYESAHALHAPVVTDAYMFVGSIFRSVGGASPCEHRRGGGAVVANAPEMGRSGGPLR